MPFSNDNLINFAAFPEKGAAYAILSDTGERCRPRPRAGDAAERSEEASMEPYSPRDGRHLPAP